MDQYDSDCTCGAVERYNMANRPPKEPGITQAKTPPSLADVVRAADRVKAALAELNDALAVAHGLNIEAVITRDQTRTEYGSSPPRKLPLRFKLSRLDFKL